MASRRFIFKLLLFGLISLTNLVFNIKFSQATLRSIKRSFTKHLNNVEPVYSHIYVAKDESPEQNMNDILLAMGGLNNLVGPDDIVILKPNAQWWAQGMTNTDAMKSFIEEVLTIQNFTGEVIIAENHHFPERNSRGWNTTDRNGKFNYNELIAYFNNRGYSNVTKYAWHDGGKSRPGLHGGAELGGVVNGPKNGDGYVWLTDKVYVAPNGSKVMMSYPIFTSEYSGITIDLMNGAWKDGRYLEDKPVKLINFAALNHHEQTGVTASIKNYMGICDLTCGHRGVDPAGFVNFHYVGHSDLHWRLKSLLKRFDLNVDKNEYIGGAIGYFMKYVRMADLNIITAKRVGYGSRTDVSKSVKTNTVLASTDPVALDYYAAKHVLCPATRKASDGDQYIDMNNPDNKDGVFYKFLKYTHEQGVGNLDPSKIRVISQG